MAVTSDIVGLWRHPRRMIRAKLAEGQREDRALAVLMGACAMIFVAQWPMLARLAELDPSVPLDARMGGTLMATVFVLPLLAYALAAGSHLVARAFGGQGSWYGARLALFWALMAAVPLFLATGLIAGVMGQTPAASGLGLLCFAAFMILWLTLLTEAERWT
jgi:hypothetical protein